MKTIDKEELETFLKSKGWKLHKITRFKKIDRITWQNADIHVSLSLRKHIEDTTLDEIAQYVR